jgi:alpha-glucuronidase
MKIKNFILLLSAMLLISTRLLADEGYDLWLKYKPVKNTILAEQYRIQLRQIYFAGSNDRFAAAKAELNRGAAGLLGLTPKYAAPDQSGLIVGTFEDIGRLTRAVPDSSAAKVGNEGYIIKTINGKGRKVILIAAKTDIGVLYGTFAFLRLLQTNKSITDLQVSLSGTGTSFRVILIRGILIMRVQMRLLALMARC